MMEAMLLGSIGGPVFGLYKGAKASKIFDKPKTPTSENTEEAKRKRMEELASRRGRQASILTGGTGVITSPTLGRSSLLGAG